MPPMAAVVTRWRELGGAPCHRIFMRLGKDGASWSRPPTHRVPRWWFERVLSLTRTAAKFLRPIAKPLIGANLPDEEQGWSGSRSMKLGAGVLQPILAVIDKVR